MIVASVLLLLIGLTDVARGARSRRAAITWTVTAWVVVAVVAVAGLGVWWLAMAGCVALTCGWMLSLPIADEQRPRQVWPVALLLLVVGTLTAFGPAVTGTTGFVVDAYSRISLGAMAEVSLATALGAVAVATFLMASGNLVARATLGRAHPPASCTSRLTDQLSERRRRG
ncbi:hypothetical protein [Georgenia sp. MJ170]|uniref:hypothetical protein n=1 Tax=Georgenia sunbinii TaxID=3117728 RepID=UPI002F25F73C